MPTSIAQAGQPAEHFERELAIQCRFGIEAAAEMDAAFAKRDRFTFFRRAQAFLSAVANVSKVLWPKNDAHRVRGEQLRSKYAVPEALLRSFRDVRNDYDHIDERLEDWARSSTVMIDFVFGTGEGPTVGIGATGNPKAFLRNFNAATGTLQFGNHDIDVPTVVLELRRLEAGVRDTGVALLQDVSDFPPCRVCGNTGHFVPSGQLGHTDLPADEWTCLACGNHRPLRP